MRSSFFEFGVAVTGLTAARASMDVTGHNITNAAKIGYSRQYVEQRANAAITAGNGRGMIPTGVDVYGIGQIRSFYLDKKYWTEMKTLGESEVKMNQSKTIEALFNEPSDTGLSAVTDKFFNLLQSLSTNPGDMTYRNNLIQQAQTLAKYFSGTSESLQRQQRELNLELKTAVEQVNAYGRQIQTLNKQIYVSELDGSYANDLRDERSVIIDKLSKLVNIEVEEVEMNPDYAAGLYYEPGDRGLSKKQLFITINGYDFVSHFALNELNTVERTLKNNPEDVDGLYDVYFTNGQKFDLTNRNLGGALKGIVDMRDGNNKDSFTGKTQVSDVLDDGRIQITLKDISRGDMQGEGNIVINGKTYAYTDFEFDEAAGEATLTIPPKKGTLTVFPQSLHYTGLEIVGDDLLLDVSLSEISSYGITFGNTSILKIGDMQLIGSKNSDGKLLNLFVGNTPYDPAIHNDPDMVVTVRINSGAKNANLLVEEVSPAIPPDPADPDDKGTPAVYKSSLNAQTAQIANLTDYKGIPYYMNRLDEFARTLARVFNDGADRNGKDLDGIIGFAKGIDLYGETGTDFFHVSADEKTGEKLYHKITAATFTVNGELFIDPRKLGCAGGVPSSEPDVSNADTVSSLAAAQHNPNLFREGEIGNYWQSIIAEVGVDSKEASNFHTNYRDITNSVNNQRLSVSGVDLNEEMSNLVKFQQVYNACSKLINTINSIYDKTINSMGV